METDSDEEEDGQISKLEEEEEKDRKLFGKKDLAEEPMTMGDLEKCRLTRDAIAKHCMVPWFEDYVKGMVYHPAKFLRLLSPSSRRVGSLFSRSG
jgi:RNA polymerase-associated protein RTF1